MPLSPAYTASQIIGSPSIIKFVDSSTGSDGSITARRIYLTDYAGNPVVPEGTTTSYILWPLADTTYLADVLLRDMAILATVQWVNTDGDMVVEVADRLQAYTMYNETFYFSLTQAQAMQNQPPPMIMQDSLYYSNKGILRTEIDSATNAVEYGGDITSAQACLDRATEMTDNESNFF